MVVHHIWQCYDYETSEKQKKLEDDNLCSLFSLLTAPKHIHNTVFKKNAENPHKVTLLLKLQPGRLTTPHTKKNSQVRSSSIYLPTYTSNSASIHLFSSHKKNPRKGGEAHTIEKCVASRKLNVKEPCLLLMEV